VNRAAYNELPENGQMASTREVDQLPDERCPDCGSRFARDLKGTGFRWHLDALAKRNRNTQEIITDDEGKRVYCGGTSKSWGKGNRS
jgi:hypothetical protein